MRQTQKVTEPINVDDINGELKERRDGCALQNGNASPNPLAKANESIGALEEENVDLSVACYNSQQQATKLSDEVDEL